MFSSALIGCFTVPLTSKKDTQGEKYIFKYFLSQLYRRVIILYKKLGHQGAVINMRETAFERSVDCVIASLSRAHDAQTLFILWSNSSLLTTHFTRSDPYQCCSGSVNHPHLSLLGLCGK